MMASHRDQIAGMVYMVRPAKFTANKSTLGDNFFQNAEDIPHDAQERALEEFDNFVTLLRENGILVTVAEDTPDPHTPDSIFPNNWFVTNSDGTLILFRLFANNRDRESHKPELYDRLIEAYRPSHILDLRPISEEMDAYLEGTGSMILDRYNEARPHQAIGNRTPMQMIMSEATNPLVTDELTHIKPSPKLLKIARQRAKKEPRR